MKNGLKALLCLSCACLLIYVSLINPDIFKDFQDLDITEILSFDDEDDDYYEEPQKIFSVVPKASTTTTTAPAPEPDYDNDDYLPETNGQVSQLQYDDRIPNYVQTEEPDYREYNYRWTSHNGRSTLYMTLYIDKNVYDYYHSLGRYYGVENYKKYIDDENNQKVIKQAADCLRDLSNQLGYDNNDTVLEAISFVQIIPYIYDIDSTGEKEFPKYPIETLFDNGGDCEDTSILLAGILKELGFGVCFIHYEGQHVAIGIKGSDGLKGSYFEYNGSKYFYIETTGENWTVGTIPDDFAGQSAKIIEL